MYLCFAYCVLANSNVLKYDFMPADIYEDLTNKLSQCHPNGDIILMGDLNARSQTLPDFIIMTTFQSHLMTCTRLTQWKPVQEIIVTKL